MSLPSNPTLCIANERVVTAAAAPVVNPFTGEEMTELKSLIIKRA